MPSFENVVLVTGGARGIGAAIALELASLPNAAIVITYNTSKSDAEKTVDRLKSAGAAAVQAVQVDLKNPTAVKSLIETTVSSYGKITSLINSAGVFQSAPAEESTEELIDHIFSNNVKTLILVTSAAVPHLRDGASVVNVATAATHWPLTGGTVYIASKGAIEAYTRTLALELAPRRIRVNTLSPGFTATDMMPDAYKDFAVQNTPFKKVGTAEDIATVGAFLAGPKSTWVTGQNLLASGGLGKRYQMGLAPNASLLNHRRHFAPAPTDSREYFVEQILAHDTTADGRLEYLVAWTDWAGWDTWEPECHLRKAPVKIKEYWRGQTLINISAVKGSKYLAKFRSDRTGATADAWRTGRMLQAHRNFEVIMERFEMGHADDDLGCDRFDDVLERVTKSTVKKTAGGRVAKMPSARVDRLKKETKATKKPVEYWEGVAI
ncbi:hypothetical protein HK101_007477 [Irineochytrium annulatum]|nr:hypothetical protein HK101_007477 [Irineochytrium annulatum]